MQFFLFKVDLVALLNVAAANEPTKVAAAIVDVAEVLAFAVPAATLVVVAAAVIAAVVEV